MEEDASKDLHFSGENVPNEVLEHDGLVELSELLVNDLQLSERDVPKALMKYDAEAELSELVYVQLLEENGTKEALVHEEEEKFLELLVHVTDEVTLVKVVREVLQL